MTAIETEVLKRILTQNIEFCQNKHDNLFREKGVSDADSRLELNRLGTKVWTYKECLGYIEELEEGN